jgi:hypothetical protein
MNELAEKNRQNAIAPSERALLERYLRVGNFLNLIHAKAPLRFGRAGVAIHLTR